MEGMMLPLCCRWVLVWGVSAVEQAWAGAWVESAGQVEPGESMSLRARTFLCMRWDAAK